jgi:hypothetical protein
LLAIKVKVCGSVVYNPKHKLMDENMGSSFFAQVRFVPGDYSNGSSFQYGFPDADELAGIYFSGSIAMEGTLLRLTELDEKQLTVSDRKLSVCVKYNDYDPPNNTRYIGHIEVFERDDEQTAHMYLNVDRRVLEMLWSLRKELIELKPIYDIPQETTAIETISSPIFLARVKYINFSLASVDLAKTPRKSRWPFF